MSLEKKVAPIRILLVGSNRKSERAIRNVLKAEGVKTRISVSKDLIDAQARLEQNSGFNLAIAEDDGLGTSTLEFIKIVRSSNYFLPVILLTQPGEERTIEQAIRAGVDQFVIKESEQQYLSLLPPLVIELAQRQSHQKALNQAEASVRDSEARYHDLFDHVPIGLFRTTPSGQVIDANSALADILGYPDNSSLMSINVKNAYANPSDRKKWRDAMAREGVVLAWRVQVMRFDGSTIWVEISSRTVHTENEELLYYEGSIRDLTDQKLAEEALIDSAERYRTLFDSAGDAIFLMQGDRFIECNNRTLELFDCTRDEIIEKTPADFSPPTQPDGRSSREKAIEKINLALEGRSQLFEWKHLRLDGTSFDVEVTLTRVDLQEGPVVQAIVKDITERNLALKNLEYHSNFEQLVTSIAARFISIGSEETDAEIRKTMEEIGQFMDVDRSLAWNFDPKTEQASLLYEWYTADVEPFAAELNVLASDDYPWIFSQTLAGEVVQIRDTDELPVEAGQIRNLIELYGIQSFLTVPMVLAGVTIGALSFQTVHKKVGWSPELINRIKIIAEIIASAIERKRSEAELKKSEARFRSLVQTAPIVIIHLSAEGRILEFNPEAERLYGRKRQDVLGLNYFETFLSEEDRKPVRDDMMKVLAGEPTPGFVNPVLATDGNERVLMWSMERLLNELENPTGVIAVGQDITELKNREETLQFHAMREQMIAATATRFLSIGTDQVEAEIIKLVEEVGEFTGADRSNLWTYNPETDQAILLHEWCAKGVQPLGINLKEIRGDEIPWLISKLEEGEILQIPRISDLPPEAKAYKKIHQFYGTKSVIHVPLMISGRPIGTFALNAVHQERFWSQDTIHFLRIICEIIANALGRQHAEEILHESEERFRRLADATFEGIVISDRGRVMDANAQIIRMLGYDRSEILGMQAVEMVAPESRDLVTKNIRSGYDEPYEHLALRKDGSIFPVEVHGRILPYAGKSVRVTAIRDITERKLAENTLRDQARRLENLRRIDQAILSAKSPQETAAAALSQMHDLFPFFAGGVAIIDFENDQVEFLAVRPQNEITNKLRQAINTVEDLVAFPESMREGAMRLESDLLETSDIRRVEKVLLEEGVRSYLEVPLIARGEMIGVLALVSEEADAFEPGHIAIAREIANSLSVSIQQARLLESEQLRRKDLELLEQLSVALRDAKKQEELFPVLVREICGLFSAQAGAIALSEDDSLQYTFIHGTKSIKKLFNEQKTIVSEIATIIHNGLPFYSTGQPDGVFKGGTTVVLPLRTDQKIYGALFLFWKKHFELDDEKRRFLNTIADMAGIALHRLQFLESLEQQVTDRTRELTALYEMAAIAASNEIQSVILSQSLDKTIETVYGTSGAIHLFDDEKNSYDMVVENGFAPEISSKIRNVSLENDLWGKVIRSGEPLLLLDLQGQPTTPELFQPSNLGNYMGAPIKVNGNVFGSISVFYASDQNPTLDDLSLLNLVADQVGIAIERSQLRNQAEKAVIMEERQRLARELHDAVTQSIYSISFLAKASRNNADSGLWDQAKEHLSIIQETAQGALKEMRSLVFELLPISFEERGLIDLLNNRLNSVEKRSGVDAELLSEGDFDLPTNVLMGIFRIAQEALNNTLKHASATAVKVHLIENGRWIEMVVEDNGTGFNSRFIDGGLGIDNMRVRAQELGGKLTINSKADQGTKVILVIEKAPEW